MLRDGPRRIPSIDQSQLNSLSFNVLHQISDLSTIYVRYIVPNRRVSLSSKTSTSIMAKKHAVAVATAVASTLVTNGQDLVYSNPAGPPDSTGTWIGASASKTSHLPQIFTTHSLARSLVHAQAFRVRRGCLSSCRTPRFASGSLVPTAWSSRSSGTTAGSALMWPGCRVRR